MLISRPNQEHWWVKKFVHGWILSYALTGIVVAWFYPFVEATADARTDRLIWTCSWMSIQILGLGITMSAWRKGLLFFATTYVLTYVALAFYWAPLLEHTLIGQITVIFAASFIAVALAYLFAFRNRQRFFITKLFEDAKINSERSQQFTTFLLAATGHDIRQPIFALNLNASMLEDLIEDRDWEGAAKVAERQREALSGVSELISSVLELAQLDTDRRKVAPEPLEFSVVIDTVLRPIQPMVTGRGIDLRLVESSRQVIADRGVVEHILANLVANAVSHADAKRVLLGARPRGDFVDLMVIDDGKGLSDQAHTLTLADIERDQDRQASRGLGVEIMFRLAKKAGLDLTLTSVPGRGVAACLRCPAPK